MDMIKKEIQKGVILYVGSAIGMKDNKIVMDIDVADNVKEVEIWHDFRMPDTNKSFPNVEKLIIKEYVIDINIPNSLFPNVKYVESENEAFLSGKYLVGTFYRSNTLFNTFCQKPGEVIDITRIDGIANFAFSGCKADEMVVCDSITSFHQVSANAFVDSAFSAKPFVNGLKLAGNLVLEVDKTAENIELPDTPYNFVFLETADMSHVKKLTVHHPDASNKLCFKNDVPETIVLKTDKELDFSDIAVLAHHSTSKGCLQNFSIIHPNFEEIDGVVYTKDKKTLVACSMSKKHVKVLDGTEVISINAFTQCKIEKVYIPGSVKKIGDEAFSTCHNLKEINFGNGVQQLGNYVFSWNEKLTKIELPPSLQEVGGYAFYKSNIKSITLNEGLSNIVQGAFVGTHIEKLYIPGSVKHIGKGAISENTKEIIMPVFLEDILQGIRRTEKINHFDHTSHIVRLQCGDKYAYLPRYVDISKFANLTKTVTDFFTDVCEGRPELWKYAEDTIDKEDLAILEYYDFNAKEAKEYLKRNAKIFALRLIQNKDEERLAKLLKMNIASNQLLKLLLEEAGETMPTARAYILEMLGNTKTNKSFSI